MNEVAEKSLYGFETRAGDDRTKNGTSKGFYDIKKLWQRSHEIIGLALQGHSNKVIAELLGLSISTISNTLNSELGKGKLSEMRKERDEDTIKVSEEITKLSEKALKVYNDIFDNDTVSHNLKKTTADTVLMDLGGHRSPTKIDSRSVHLTATMEEIESFKQRGIAAAKESGMLIELTPKAKDISDGKEN